MADLSTPEGKLVERLRSGVLENVPYSTKDGWNIQDADAVMSEAADALSRIAAERDEARLLVTEANNSLYGSQGYFHSLNGGPFDKYHLANGIEKLKAYGREQWRNLEAAERERDELKAEVTKLREIVSQCAAALPNRAFVSPDASLEMMSHLPGEISMVCARLRTPEESP